MNTWQPFRLRTSRNCGTGAVCSGAWASASAASRRPCGIRCGLPASGDSSRRLSRPAVRVQHRGRGWLSLCRRKPAGERAMTERMRGGIIKRGSIYYYVVRERDSQTGKTKPHWVKGDRSRKITEEMRDAARHAVNRGTYVAARDLKVGKYLDDWIEAHSVELKPSTIASYKNKINLYLKPAIGHERLQALSPNGLSVVFRDLHKHGGADGKPVSARTVEFARAVLRRAMNDAVVNRLIEVNPVIG